MTYHDPRFETEDADEYAALCTEADYDDDDKFAWQSEDVDTGCECEQDWDCGRHGGPRLTWIETRYQGLDEDEGRHFGVAWLEQDLNEPF